jgi:hypothetical protein
MINFTKKWLGIFYIIVGSIFIANLVYLFFYSYDGEVFAIFLFPIGLLAISFIFKGFLSVFSSSSTTNPVTTTSQIPDSHSKVVSRVLLSNVIVLPLIVILCVIILATASDDGLLGLALLMYGGIAAAIYFTLTIIIYSFSSASTYSSIQSNKREKTGFIIFLIFTLYLTNASLEDYPLMRKEKAIQDVSNNAGRAFFNNLKIGSSLAVLTDFYRNNANWDIQFNAISIGSTQEAFKQCEGNLKTHTHSFHRIGLYYINEVLVLKKSPSNDRSTLGSIIEFDTRIITVSNNNTVTICNVNVPTSDLLSHFGIFNTRDVKLIPVKVTGV